ncbi:E3 ubiquitin-protein ligase TRAIP-like [Procambarus clarkii]|uniref:E3 ubiquitin-protein ligase TRAIP n=1 Tax=Procambarus clarkii TaxID=6728 RepID=UPI001E6769A2|nr:E3 ubiquitin-protein ligase TRAIP-like [Procambarus clarkii]XP_045581552.1 E3 ubiquitin-protein ligase TRAIP-like [Procambarus clarkii]XP_045581553.1 E3 ubiquitin-protein ligase TRAIP-like [Procambarus clarkii]XP_045581554.1 E3 ubiquitin-protein ligase TRAIP-like [Procambarus clarkii]
MRAGCVICGDLFVSTDDISATPCGHTFHSLCLIQWIERSKSCPQCRSKATEKSLVKLYFDTGGTDTSQVDPDTLQNHIDGLKFQVRLKDQEIKNLKDSNSTLTKQTKGLREECKKVESQVQVKETTIMALKTQLQFMDRITKEAQKAKDETKSLREHLKVLQNVESIVSGTSEDVEDMLMSYTGNPDSMRSLATFCSILKKELNKTVDDKKRLRDEASSLRSKAKEARQNYNAAVTELSVLQLANKNLQDDVKSLERENVSLKKKINALEQAISSPSGDVKNSAIHRLIAESPAPAEYKRPHSSSCDGDEDDVLVTPEIVRKVARSETAAESNDEAAIQSSQSSLSDSSQFNLKVNLFPGRRPLVKICQPTNSQHHNIFAKNKPSLKDLGMSPKTSSGPHVGLNQMGYDGLGGHHKVDEFPKPKQVFLKKKTGIKVVNKGGSGSMVQSTTLKDFFQNTFDD